MTKSEMLQYAINNGIIDMADVSAQIDMQIRKEILSNYHYWQGSDGRFYTKLPASEATGGKKRKISRSTEAAIQDAIMQFHKELEEKHTITSVYEEWIEEKARFGLQTSSVIKYNNNAARFFDQNKDFCKMDLRNLNDDIMYTFVNETIHDLGLTSKAYADMKTLLNGVLKYAKRKGYTDYSIGSFFIDFQTGKQMFAKKSPKKSPKKSEKCFTRAELKKLHSRLAGSDNVRDLALLLQLYTGLRVGELTALKACDNISRCKLLITRTEAGVIDSSTGKRTLVVKERTKTAAGEREIIIPDRAQEIIRILKRKSFGCEFLISEKGKRLTSKQINYHLQKICKELGMKPHATHSLRRAYASMLIESNVGRALVTAQLGHTEIETTFKSYYEDLSDDYEKLSKMNEATAI